MQPTVVPILATPMGVLALPEASPSNPLVADIVTRRARADLEAAAPGRSGPSPLVQVGADDAMAWGEAPVRALLGEILRGISWMARSVNRFAPGEFESFSLQARASYLIVSRDGGLGARNHPMSAWTGIYCIEAPEPAPERADSGQLRIYESRMGNMFADATTDTMVPPYRPGHYGYRLVQGTLVIFPGAATYEIAPVRAAGRLLALTVRARFVAPGQSGVARW
jgi:hypothetical protein